LPAPLRVLLLAPTLALAAATASPAATPRTFPRGFLWGTAVAGFQAEMGGQPTNADPGSDWWAWTHDAANVSARRVSGDLPERGPGEWNVYRRDIALAARALHAGALRLSVEWSRVFPRSTAAVRVGRRITRRDLLRLDRLADGGAVRHYRRVLAAIRRVGMAPFVTVNHFALPLWIHDPIAARDAFAGVGPEDPPPTGFAGGWLERATVSEFRKYAAYLGWKLGDLVDLWAPINEPLVVVQAGYAGGNFPPGVSSFAGAARVLRNLERANAAAYDALKAEDRHARVGLVQSMVAFTPANPGSALDVRGARHADYLFNRLFVNAAVRGDVDADADGRLAGSERHRHGRKADFVGVNYYLRGRVLGLGAPLSRAIPILDFIPQTSYSPPTRCPTTCTELHWEIYPEGLRAVLELAGSYHLPVYVTENGIADADDDQRPAYLREHLRVLRRAMADGVADVRGYFHWSLVDNFEWASGYAPKFGLYSFDPVTLRRTPRPSARLFARVARTNRVP
jgi:beta-galactosidase